MKKNLLFIVISAILSLLILWPIRETGSWYPMHDSTHSARVLLMSDAMQNGQIPPVWADSIGGGLGYPLFHFYAPLFHTVTSFFSFTVSPITSAIKTTLLLSIFTGILGVMMFAKRWGRASGIVAGFAFALAPYAAINIYVRGAFSEYLSIALLPWIFLTTERINTTKKMIIASIFLALFVLSHNLIPILALPMILIWMIYNNRANWKYVFGTIALAILQSSWFVAPLLFERGFTQADKIAKTTDYKFHFVYLEQLWNSTWGFGGSGPGLEDGMSFKLGKLHLLLASVGVAYAIIRKQKPLILLAIFALFSVFLATSYSQFVWDNISVLQIVQFPWRALGIVTIFLSIFAGYAASKIPSRLFRIISSIIIIFAFVGLNYKYFVPQTISLSPLDKSEIALNEIPDISGIVPEYEPVWLSQDNKVVTDSTIIERAYYPTWEVILDGTKVPIYPSEGGKLAFYNPSNSSNYSFHQSHTMLENISTIISIITLFIMLKLYVKK